MIKAPTECPSCSEPLTRIKDQLFCYNSDCGSIRQKKLEHFCKSLKIKGLGPASLEKLNFNTFLDIYTQDLNFFIEKLGSEKISEKIIQEIEYSKGLSLNDILPALGIPLIGKSASDKLSLSCDSIFDINKETCCLAGLGPKATESLITWIDNNFDLISKLPFDFEFKKLIGGKGICITGKLKSYKTKELAYEQLKKLGFTIKDSVTKEVKYLVNESGTETSKTKKARESGVIIIENLIEFIGELNNNDYP